MAGAFDSPGMDIESHLRSLQRKSLLRFITCGSVDDGKSTLIGRLLYQSHMIFDDQLAALEADSRIVGTRGGELDLALLADGLSAEREQGITIDVAYRFFSTDTRAFIVADTPGHEQYTRNMVTGASNADLAIVLVDARNGVLTQTRRHSYIVSLLGIPRIVLAVNKMDLVGYSRDVFAGIEREYREFAAQIGVTDVTCIPSLRGPRRHRRPAWTEPVLVRRPHAAGVSRACAGWRYRRVETLPARRAVCDQADARLPRLCRLHRQRSIARRRRGASAAVWSRDEYRRNPGR